MAWKDVIGAAFIADIGGELVKKALSGAGEMISKKVTQDFGGENNPLDEKLDMMSTKLMDPQKREIWNQINASLNEHGGDGPLAARVRRQTGTKRRVLFAAMMTEIPTITATEKIGRVIGTVEVPNPDFKPLATQVKEDCVDIFLAEQKAQVSVGKSRRMATKIAQRKVEIYLLGAGFPIVSDQNPYRHIDEFIVRLPENAAKAARASKIMINNLISKVPAVKLALEDGYIKFIEHTDNYAEDHNRRPGLVGLLSQILP